MGERERGGQRPALRPVQDTDGTFWGKIGEGPIQAIASIERPAELTGFEIGECVGTHEVWEWRAAEDAIDGNLFLLRGKEKKPSLSRHAMVGSGFANNRQMTDMAWYDDRALFGGVNEVAAGTPPTHLIFKADYAAGDANDGFGSPVWTPYTNPFTGDPRPVERVATFPASSSYSRLLIAAHTTPSSITGTGDSQGFLVVYDRDATTKLTPAAGENPHRPFGNVYADAGGSQSVDPGAVEIKSIQCVQLGNSGFLYYAYRARPQDESCVGRLNVSNFAVTGFDPDTTGSGSFQMNGYQFAQKFVNYPRGAIPTDLSIDPSGNVYVTRNSSGWGPAGDPNRHPDDPSATPVNIIKVNAAATAFLWESVTNVDPGETGFFRASSGNEELRWVEADADGCYVGGREVLGGSVFRVRGSDGAVLWQWRHCAEGDGESTINAYIDADDGHIIVVGNRTTDWQGVVASRAANCWKLHKTTGAVIWDADIGDEAVSAVAGLSIHINPVTGLMAVGTVATS